MNVRSPGVRMSDSGCAPTGSGSPIAVNDPLDGPDGALDPHRDEEGFAVAGRQNFAR